MGRRKIEIKAIKDDRNRSVTFLKRKGGLFKKAHELSVLCSVDVAVIIFGNNKKLYEYSSSDITEILNRHNYYGNANEHKGPADFNGKKDLDDDDDDDMGTPQPDHRISQDPQMMPPQYQHPGNQFQHIRHHTASASPPISNGVPFHHSQQRQHTPQPHQISRPASRNDGPRRVGSSLAQHHGMPQVSGPQQGANGFTYIQNPSIYNAQGPQMPPGMMQHPQQPPQSQQQQHQQQQQPPFQYPAPPPPPPPQHMQQAYIEDAQRQSMPPTFQHVERAASMPHRSPPQPQSQSSQQQQQQQQQPLPPPPPQQQQQPKPEPSIQETRQQMLEPIKRAGKSRSIFTPIDEDRSVLSKHWHSSTTAAEPPQNEPAEKRPLSVDVAAMARNVNGAIAPPPSPPRTGQPHSHNKDRNISMSSIDFQPPSRTNSGMSQMGSNVKRPRLKVQIPDEASDNDSQTAGSGNSAQGTNSSHPSRPHAGTDSSHSGGPGSTMGIVTLPPPSPSTSTIQSAGASGPPNPFARPLPPSTNNTSNSNPNQTTQNPSNSNGNGIRGGSGGGLAEIETPVSALPSRFMNTEFLPSPSSFYPEWNYRSGRGMDSAGGMELQSPLNFATPVVGNGPSFLRDDRDKEANAGGGMKRTLQSPDGEKGSTGREHDAKRLKNDG